MCLKSETTKFLEQPVLTEEKEFTLKLNKTPGHYEKLMLGTNMDSFNRVKQEYTVNSVLFLHSHSARAETGLGISVVTYRTYFQRCQSLTCLKPT